ncbi:MAG: SAM-dependent methyltransferase, partial [Chloroflexota bacterium]
MDLSAFTNLLTKEGQWALESAEAFSPIEKDFLADFQMLSKRFPREIARAALETAILRGEARKKFPQAEKMYFTREALEQASSWEISQVRAARFQGFSQVVDLGCSIGSDSLAFSTVTNAVGVEKDPLRIEMAKENAKALASSAVFIKSDITEQNFISQFDANSGLFIDPARRKDHRRVKNVEEYQPPLSIIKPWLVGNRAVGVKISPGVNL